jgi:hypothetical protein
MPKRRQARPLATLSIVLAVHVIFVWLLMSSPQRLVKTKSGAVQLIWIPQEVLSKIAPEQGAPPRRSSRTVPRHRIDRALETPSIAPPSSEEDNAIHPTPDWSEELELAAKKAVANELAKKKHDGDFAHVFPTQPRKPPQFAWNYAATHRVEVLPQGGLLFHINDSCVLLIFPLPFVGCGIGKLPANGNLFEHMREK